MLTRRVLVTAGAAISLRPLCPQSTPRPAADRAVFIFQNNFWVNLHHFLRGEARRRSMNAPLELPLDGLNAAEQAAWERGLRAYADLSQVSLISDDKLRSITNSLAIMPDGAKIETSGVEPDLLKALNCAAAVYRSRRWEEHRAANADWTAVHTPAIHQHAAAIRKTIARIFHAAAPAKPILADLARDIGPNLAYTIDGPKGTSGHTLIAPQKNVDSEVALDTAFHEISHTMDRQIIRLFEAEAARQHVKPPPDLWHAVTLYTTWKATKREMGKEDDPAYKPDAANAAMFERNGWPKLLTALEQYWKPHLEGKASFSNALREVVRLASQ